MRRLGPVFLLAGCGLLTPGCSGTTLYQPQVVARGELTLRYQEIGVEEKLAKLCAEARIRARGGDAIARMLGGLQHGQRLGAFDVPSDFAAAAGRPCASIDAMLQQVTAR